MKVLDYTVCVCNVGPKSDIFEAEIVKFYEKITIYLNQGYTPVGGLTSCDGKLIQSLVLYDENKRFYDRWFEINGGK